jgi:hypothetical protein
VADSDVSLFGFAGEEDWERDLTSCSDDDSVLILDDLRFVVWVYCCFVLLLVVVVDGEWLFVRRGAGGCIRRRGTCPGRPSRRICLHMLHVAILNISRRKW